MTAIRYPAEFTSDPGTDYIELQFARRNYDSGAGNSPTSKIGQTWIKESEPIILNVPQKVTEQMSQQFNNSVTGEIGPFLSKGAGAAGEFLKNVAQRYVENFALNKVVEQANKLGASQFTDNGILSATSGIVFNPNLEVLYEGPDFRSFNFQFAMFTKSEPDAKAIYAIVDTLRKKSLPSIKANSNENNLAVVFSNSANIQTASAAFQGIANTISSTLSGQGGGIQSMIGGLFGAVGSAGTGLATLGGHVFSGDNRFIKQPPFILIKYKRGPNLHPFIQPLLPAAINSINFDFTPTGNYTQLSNFDKTKQATTVGVVITMQVTEVTNLFSDIMFDNLPVLLDK